MGASCTKAGREEAAFLRASKEGDCQIVQQAITQDVEWAYKVQTWNGQSVFHLAARYGRLDVLETVVEAVRFNPAGPEKWSKLLRMGHSTDALLRAFANLQDARCQTPLHLACIYGHADVAQRLLELGSTPWAWDELGGRTPLHYAASMGHVDVIQVVVSHNAPAPTGEALRRPNTSRTKLVDICNDSGYTPLHYAVWAGNTASIRALTSYEASLSARNVACGSDWVVSCLKCTPLHLAAHKGNEAVVRLLLSAFVQSQPPQGADAPPITDRRRRDPRRHVNANRQLPYHVAVSRNHTRLSEILHPDVPFSFILSPAEMESRLYGVAKLAVLASKVLQQKLVMDIEAAVAAMAAAQHRGGCAIAASGRARSGSLAALSGAMAAAAAAGQGGAVTAQQVLAAATARLRAAGERSLSGAPSGAIPASPGLDALAALAAAPSTAVLAEHARAAPGRASVDSTASAPATASATGANAAAAAGTQGGGGAVVGTAAPGTPAAASSTSKTAPASGGSSATSGADSEREALPVEAVQDLGTKATTPGPADPATCLPNQTQGAQQEPLPLPPAPISPFLPAAATAGGAAAGSGAASAARPLTFNDAASAFARFAAEPFDESSNGNAGQALQPAGSASVSLAALAHNREAQQAASSQTMQNPVASSSISIAALSRGRPAGSTSAYRQPGAKARSLRKLLTGSRLRRSTSRDPASSQHGPQQQQQQAPAMELPRGNSAGVPGEQPGLHDDEGDDLDDILYAMRPTDTDREGDAAGRAAAGTPAAGSAAGQSQAQQQPQEQQDSRRTRTSGLKFWRRATSQAQSALTPAQSAPDSASMPVATHAALAAAGARPAPSPTPLISSGQLTSVPSASIPNALPPGVVETRYSVDKQPAAAAAPAAAPANDGVANGGEAGPSANPAAAVTATAADSEAALSTGVAGAVVGGGMRRNSISLAVLARAGADAAVGTPFTSQADGTDGTDGATEPAVDGAVLAMLASLVEAPQHVLRRYRLLQLTHGLDLQDLLRDHSEQQQQAAAGGVDVNLDASVAPTATVGAANGESPARPLRPSQSGTVLELSSRCNVPAANPVVQVDGAAGPAAATAGPSPRGLGNGNNLMAVEATAPANPAAPTVSPFAVATQSLARQPTGNGVLPGAVGAGPSPVMGAGGSANLAGQLLRTLSSAAASESGEGTCGVCFDQPDNLKITGCGHRLCADCSRELCKLNTFKPALCPFCRGMIGGFKFVGR